MKAIFMGRNTSVSLGDYFEAFVDDRIAQGRYNNASEVIRAGLRLLEDEENKFEALRAALKAGEKSGTVKNFKPDAHLKMLKARKKSA
jgi:antitoxin ParD1/3/4